MPKRWSEAIKIAVMADLTAGMTVKAVAEKYGMPRSTAGHLAPSSQRGAAKISKIADLHQLKAELEEQLAYRFAAQKNILGQTFDAKWMARQPASELNAMLDSSFRQSGKLLGALYGPGASAAIDADDTDAPS